VKELLTKNKKTITLNLTPMLKFSIGNAKLQGITAIFDLPAGHSCPFANLCKSSANRITGRITDGPNTQFRCYAATGEARSPQARRVRWHNFELLRKCKSASDMASLIANCLPETMRIRIHSSGDFFNQDYFDAWLMVARQFPDRIFYAYTKALPFWIKRLGSIPSNFKLVASYGGTHDNLIVAHGLKSCLVVSSEEQARELGLELDHDDTHAWKGSNSFALLVHGTQPAGTPMAKAWEKIKREGVGGYTRERKEHAWKS
jgi:hypothetical protein